MTDLAKLVVKLEAETARYAAELDKAQKKLASFESGVNLSLGKITKSFAAVGAAIGAGLFAIGANAINAADHINDLSKSSGVSTENLSKLAFAFKQGGLDGEGFATIIKKLNVNIAEAAGNAKSEAAAAFKALGISVKDARGNVITADQAIVALANKFEGFADGPNKVAIAIQLMGRAGEGAIPTLNEGSKALAVFGEQAERLGLVIRQETATAADEFNDRLGALSESLFKGLGNRIAEHLLPSLNALGQVFDEDAGRVATFDAIAGVLATTLKVLVASGIIVTSVFQQLGRIIYGVNAALLNLVSGDFRQAGRELVDTFKDVKDNVGGDMKKVTALFKENSALLLEEVRVTVKKIKEQAPNIAAAKAADDAATKALDKLRELNEKLKEQTATFGQGETAVIRYRLAVGDLADEVNKAGSAGAALRDSIIEQSQALERLKNADAIAQIDNQILSLTGHTKEAALAAFDLQNRLLKTSLQDSGDEAGLKRLDTLRSLITAQAEFNELQVEQDKISDQLAAKEEQIQNALRLGAITDLQAIQETTEARKETLAQLEEVRVKMDAIAEASDNPALKKGAQDFGREVEKLASQVDLLGEKVRTTFVEAGSSAFADFITGAKSASEAVTDFFQDLARQAAEAIAKNYMQQIFGNLLGGSNEGGTFATIAGALFGGGKAKGGKVRKGFMYPVNERSGHTEYFAPGMDGSIIPSAMSQTIEQNFAISAPNGQVSRQTQQQIAAAAARGIAQANRRNN